MPQLNIGDEVEAKINIPHAFGVARKGTGGRVVARAIDGSAVEVEFGGCALWLRPCLVAKVGYVNNAS